jgi:hypothetical protein
MHRSKNRKKTTEKKTEIFQHDLWWIETGVVPVDAVVPVVLIVMVIDISVIIIVVLDKVGVVVVVGIVPNRIDAVVVVVVERLLLPSLSLSP